ncbi:MAG: phosphate acetyltransferase [Egibacteraceae bacterium]
MARSLYLASLEANSGKSVAALGLMELLSRRLQRIGYLRPVVPAEEDARTRLIAGRYGIADEDAVAALTAEEVQRLQADGQGDEVFKRVLSAYKQLEQRCEFVLCDGTDYTGVSTAFEFEFNAAMANHLGAPVLALLHGRRKTASQLVGAARVARESLAAEGCSLAAIFVNRVNPDDVEQVRTALRDDADAGSDEQQLDRSLTEAPVYVLPEEPMLAMPTVGEIARAIGATDLSDRSPDRTDLEREVGSYKIAAMQPSHFLTHIEEGALVITPGDRGDIIMASLGARLATSYPNIAGLVLSGGLRPEQPIQRLIDGFSTHQGEAPILCVESDTYETARDVMAVRATLRPEQERKIATALGLFEANVDTAELEQRIELARSDRVTPLMFEYELVERARADRRRIVLPEGDDDRVLRAAELLARRGVAELVVLGDEEKVRNRASALGLDLGKVELVNPASSPLHESYAQRYAELRSHKGVTPEHAAEVIRGVSYFGTMMVHAGDVDGMVSGAAHTTGHTIRPAFEFVRTRPGVEVVSSVFLMCMPDRVLVYGDCAVIPDPDASQLADIAVSSAATAEKFGIEPRVAMLSYSTGESGSGSDVEKVREATALVRERRADLKVDGPIQYDAAVDASVAAAKAPDSPIAGDATVFIFPDLNTGNNTYKAVQRSAGAVAIGPVLQGLNKPVNDLSRGCTVADIVNTVAITAIQAQAEQS